MDSLKFFLRENRGLPTAFTKRDLTPSRPLSTRKAPHISWTYCTAHNHAVTYVPAHRVDPDFPSELTALSQFDVTVLSDVGANTFLLPKRTFTGSEIDPNRLEVLRKYVAGGGGFLMIGGYMSFSGIGGRARYGSSPIADLLPVVLSDGDDRVEVPEGFVATVAEHDHEALSGVPTSWPPLLGYNRLTAKDDTVTLVPGITWIR